MLTDDELKSVLHRAAEMVKDLPEAIQGEAFNRAFESLTEASTPSSGGGPRKQQARSAASAPRKASAPSKGKTPRKKSSPTRLKDLNLRPRGGKSFEDFVSDKQPQTDHERKLVAVYYLTNILEVDGVTVDHVYSCFKEMSWKVPSNLPNSLQLTATRKAWLDTSDMSSIRVAIPGENYVELDLPRKDHK